MAEKFTVQVLNEKEWATLPYSGISDSLGIADPHKNLAFVRDTGNKEWNLETLTHEVNHLIEKNGDHADEYGIMHKKGGVLRSIAPAILGAVANFILPGSGILVGAAANAGMDQYAKSNHPEQLGEAGKPLDILGAAASGAVQGAASGGAIAGGKAAAPGFLSKAGGIAGGAIEGALHPIATNPLLGSGNLASATPGLTGFERVGTGITGAIPAAPKGPVLPNTPGYGANTPAGVVNTGSMSLLPPKAPIPSPSVTGMGFTAPNILGSPISPNVSPYTPPSGPTVPTSTSMMSLPSGQQGNILGQPIPNSTAIPSTANAPMSLMPTVNTPPNVPAGTGGVSTVADAAAIAAKNVGTETAKKVPTFGEKVGEFVTNPMNILGAGSLGASMLTPSPAPYQLPADFTTLQSKLSSGNGALTPVGQQAQLELSKILSSKPTDLYPTANDEYFQATLRRTRESYANAEKELDAAYNLAGVYGSGEHLAEKAKMKEQLARTESGVSAEIEQRRFELARTTQYQALQDSLGVDKGMMDDLVGLTGLSAEMAAQVYGAKVSEVIAMRQSLGTLGVEALLRGSGLKSGNNITLSLAK